MECKIGPQEKEKKNVVGGDKLAWTTNIFSWIKKEGKKIEHFLRKSGAENE